MGKQLHSELCKQSSSCIARVSLGFCQAYVQDHKDDVSTDQFQNVYQNHIIVRQQENHCLWLVDQGGDTNPPLLKGEKSSG